jgi:putative endonuclease
MHYVYVLHNHQRRTYYVGYTNDVNRRLDEHAKRKPGFVLMYYEAYADASSARRRERKLKLYGSAWRGLKARIQPA